MSIEHAKTIFFFLNPRIFPPSSFLLPPASTIHQNNCWTSDPCWYCLQCSEYWVYQVLVWGLRTVWRWQTMEWSTLSVSTYHHTRPVNNIFKKLYCEFLTGGSEATVHFKTKHFIFHKTPDSSQESQRRGKANEPWSGQQLGKYCVKLLQYNLSSWNCHLV